MEKVAAKLSRTFLVGPRGDKDKDKIAKGEGGVRTDSQTIKNLVMVLVTTLTALDPTAKEKPRNNWQVTLSAWLYT